MCQPLIKFHPHPAIITQVLCIFAAHKNFRYTMECRECFVLLSFRDASLMLLMKCDAEILVTARDYNI